MNLEELYKALMTGEHVKVLSGRTGKVLIHEATREEKRACFGKLEINGIRAKIDVSADGDYAHPIFTCYCNEDEYKKLKAARDDG